MKISFHFRLQSNKMLRLANASDHPVHQCISKVDTSLASKIKHCDDPDQRRGWISNNKSFSLAQKSTRLRAYNLYLVGNSFCLYECISQLLKGEMKELE